MNLTNFISWKMELYNIHMEAFFQTTERATEICAFLKQNSPATWQRSSDEAINTGL